MTTNVTKNKTEKVAGLIGKKMGMTTWIAPNGDAHAVTVIEACPCEVVQVKSKGKDGYDAAQVGYGEVRRRNKPLVGHFKKNNIKTLYRKLKEFPVSGPVEAGQFVTVDILKEGDLVDVSGISKGKGLAGVVKRYHFAGGFKTHGGNAWRIPGNTGAGNTNVAEVWKNKRLPGRMGNKKSTVQGLRILKILADENTLLVKGAIPGHTNAAVIIRKSVKTRKAREIAPATEKKAAAK